MGNAEENHRCEIEYWLGVVPTREEIDSMRLAALTLETAQEGDWPEWTAMAKTLRAVADRAAACHKEDHSYDYGD